MNSIRGKQVRTINLNFWISNIFRPMRIKAVATKLFNRLLDYNDDTKTMFCSFCQSFPITADRSNALTRGTTNLIIEPIKIHESNPEHFSCHRLWLKNKGFDVPKAKLADTALGKAIIKKKCTPEQTNRYAVLFNTAYDLQLDKESLKHDTDGPKLVCANFDGASVNFGSKSRVFQKIKEFVPERRRELKAISKLFNNDFAHLGHIKGVRWLSSKERALKALVKNLEAVVAYLEHSFERGGRADDANKAKGYHTEVTSLRFLKVLYFLLDFLPMLAKLSRVFQEEKYLIFEISEHVDIVLAQLEQLKRSDGKHMKEFITKLDLENRMFGTTIKLQSRCFKSVDFRKDKDLHQLLDDTISYVKSRKPRILQKYDIPAIYAFTVHDENCLYERYATKWIKSLGQVTTYMYSNACDRYCR
uniref:Uncharacterized protein n=1 Tax=Magallana gigas TaxID=29159 RepID=A0A8W8KDE4_MAGGI